MKLISCILVVFLLMLGLPAFAQKAATTSSARAAYSMPSSNWYHKGKKKKSQKVKSRKTKKAKKRTPEADRERRRSLSF